MPLRSREITDEVVCGKGVQLWAAVVVMPFDGVGREWRWSYKDAGRSPVSVTGDPPLYCSVRLGGLYHDLKAAWIAGSTQRIVCSPVAASVPELESAGAVVRTPGREGHGEAVELGQRRARARGRSPARMRRPAARWTRYGGEAKSPGGLVDGAAADRRPWRHTCTSRWPARLEGHRTGGCTPRSGRGFGVQSRRRRCRLASPAARTRRAMHRPPQTVPLRLRTVGIRGGVIGVPGPGVDGGDLPGRSVSCTARGWSGQQHEGGRYELTAPSGRGGFPGGTMWSSGRTSARDSPQRRGGQL